MRTREKQGFATLSGHQESRLLLHEPGLEASGFFPSVPCPLFSLRLQSVKMGTTERNKGKLTASYVTYFSESLTAAPSPCQGQGSCSEQQWQGGCNYSILPRTRPPETVLKIGFWCNYFLIDLHGNCLYFQFWLAYKWGDSKGFRFGFSVSWALRKAVNRHPHVLEEQFFL